MDISIKHPSYLDFESSWKLMRDAMEGEDRVKAEGSAYLPIKPGLVALSEDDPQKARASYRAYQARAEFPEVLSPVMRGILGILTEKPPVIELPPAMESLKEGCTLDGMTFDTLFRRCLLEILITGRYALLPSLSESGEPYIAPYSAESLISWETDRSKRYTFAVLDESGLVRNSDSNEWSQQESYLELGLDEAGVYRARSWEAAPGSSEPVAQEWVTAKLPKTGSLEGVPLVVIGTDGIHPQPDDIPLYGLAKLAFRYYRVDADFMHALHMTSEPTPVATGVTQEMIDEGTAPVTLGSAVIWYLPEGGDAKYLEFAGAGLAKQQETLKDTIQRARDFGARLLSGSSDQSGEALALLLGSQTAPLKSIAINVAAGIEKALRNLASWMGHDPDLVVVRPHLDFYTQKMTPAEQQTLVDGWLKDAYSWSTLFKRLQEGGVIPEGVTEQEEARRLLNQGNTSGDDLT